MTEPSGYTALDLIGFTDKGEYDAATNYVRNDLVHVGNDVWKCLADDTLGVTPAEGAYWTIFIENDSAASNVNYTNTSSGLAATDVQNAIDELASEKADSATTLAGYGIADAYTSTQADNAISTAINALDVSDSAVAGSYVTAVSEADGSISVTREAADATPTASSTKMVTSGGVYTALSAKADQTTIGDSYNASTTYAVDDRFVYSGVRYKVLVACTGITPPNTNYYAVLPIDDDTAALESEIDTLNSSLTNLLTETDITSSVTFPNATLVYGGVFTKGNICSIKCNIEITTEIGNAGVLINNIPLPLAKGNSSPLVKLCPVRTSLWSLTVSKWQLQSFAARTYISNATQTLAVGDIIDLDWTYIIDN